MPVSDAARARATGLFRLIRDYAALRSRPRTDVEREEACLWLADLPEGPGCTVRLPRQSGARNDEGESDERTPAWLVLEKRHEPPCPEPPAVVVDWLDRAWPFDPEAAPPQLLESIAVDGGDGASVSESDAGDTADALDTADAVVTPPTVPAATDDSADEPDPTSAIDGSGDSDSAESATPADAESATDSPAAPAGPPRLHLHDHPGVRAAFERWTDEVWTPFVAAHAEWRQHDVMYTGLFAMHQSLKRREEDLELIVGLGCVTWGRRDEDGEADGALIRRHLIAIPAAIEFEATSGRLEVVAAAEPAYADLEALPPTERPDGFPARVTEAAESLAEPPLDRGRVSALLSSAANALDGGRGVFTPDDARPGTPDDRPRVTVSPALVLRRRGRGMLVERLHDIAERVEAADDLPPVVARIAGTDGTLLDGGGVDASPAPVPDASARRDVASPAEAGDRAASAAASDAASAGTGETGGTGDSGGSADFGDPADSATVDGLAVRDRADALLPLPANREQFAMLERLDRGPGVLVQGPPGTGKSHTIANLVCHLLAEGKRVLVTAESPRALAVLRDKLPEPIRPLCIALVGSDGRALDELAASVTAIVERSDADFARDADVAERSAHRRRAILDDLAAIDHGLVTRVVARQTPHAVPGTTYRGTPQAIAEAVAAAAEDFEWFDGSSIEPERTLPASAMPSLLRLRDALRTVPADVRDALRGHRLPTDDEVPAPGAVRAAMDRERTLAARAEVLAATSPEGPDPRDIVPEAIDDADRALGELLRLWGELRGRDARWIERACDEILSGRGETWLERARVAGEYAREIAEVIGPVEERELTVPGGTDRSVLRADARDLLRRLESGGSLGMVAKLIDGTVRRTRYVAETVRVDGRPCDTVDALRDLLESLDVDVRMEKLVDYLGDLADVPTTGPLRLRFASLRRTLEDLEAVVELDGAVDAAREAAEAACAPHVQPPVWNDRDAVEGWHGAVARSVVQRSIAGDAQMLDTAASALRALAEDGVHAVAVDLADALTARDAGAWQVAERALAELRTHAAALDEVDALRAAELDGDPALAPVAQSIADDPDDAAWGTRLEALPDAWGHAQAAAWVRRVDAGEDAASAHRRAARLRDELERVTAELVEAQAWLRCRESLDEGSRRALQAWVLANRNLGRGTGKYAARRRRKARELLAECRDAVPAWIMPFYRVIEQVEPRPEAFDVVIVDEASQCGLEATALAWLGRHLVVVGDDEQISPTVIIDREPLFDLSRKHLGRDPVAAVLEPDTSLFDLGRIWFDDPVRLREHFRCMPEIIGFSDKLAYEGRLVPLRQAPPDRLDPVRTIHVPDGVRKAKSDAVTNPPEAEAIVAAIERCHADPAYGDRTFGVISLLGEAQATLIESMLARRIGPEAMGERAIICGDAYSFQGDERDVMFLGLVAAPRTPDGGAARLTALVRRDAKQRFNVAASRARDQLWLAHSVELAELSHPDDLRRRLLEYCLDPAQRETMLTPPDDAELTEVLAQLDRHRDPPPRPFTSWLAVGVHEMLRARGHCVLPGHRVAGETLDLVVTDGRRMVAVACEDDGRRDRAEVRRALEARRRLERAGWRFADVSGTRVPFGATSALEDVWRQLDAAGIGPWSPGDPISGVDGRRDRDADTRARAASPSAEGGADTSETSEAPATSPTDAPSDD